MKKFVSIICSAAIAVSGGALCGFKTEKTNDEKIISGCKSAYLMDFNSGECVYKQNETARMPIASVCKVMTLTLTLDAVKAGKLKLDDKITVSEKASGMGGSQVFLQSGLQYPLDSLIKSIVVCSANDSCVAVSETIAGSEEVFVAQMNEKAKELGCNNTLFANCTGLPKDTQYSCAEDVAKMFRNLITHEEYFNYSKVWLEDFSHPDNRVTSMTNTNKLIRKYNLCDGGKTGFTNEAGFCLAATAKKDSLRFVSVILGGTTSDDRFNSTLNMFEYGFANFKNRIVLDKNVTLNDKFNVVGGKTDSVLAVPERNSYIFSKTDQAPEITHNVINYNVKAPVAKGDLIGKIEVYKNGVLCDEVGVVAAEDVLKANYIDFLKLTAENWAI